MLQSAFLQIVVSYVLGRLREPSTYAGGSALIGALTALFGPQYADLALKAAAFLGALAVVVTDRSSKLKQEVKVIETVTGVDTHNAAAQVRAIEQSEATQPPKNW